MPVLFINARSVLNKCNSLSSAIDTFSAHIIALTETWLHDNVQNVEIFQDAYRFCIYRCDRDARRGGDVLVAVSKDFSSSRIDVNTNLEIIWVSLIIGHQNIVIGICYRPPTYTNSFVPELHDSINDIVSRFPLSPIFLFGD